MMAIRPVQIKQKYQFHSIIQENILKYNIKIVHIISNDHMLVISL